ncbi:hypothetical protein AGLY_007692 [Aphis glycines]|uniref:Uncharacterized protein n=1 Tax=Aphis glycines TaxID=307491 RepID=A0A6G0TN72_APHGL|nr:hypothetical protein AGLY_007692 [Aphis glycines]
MYIRGWGGPRTRLFEAKLMENLVLNFLTIYDLYFLNNNKYQKSFEAKRYLTRKIYGEPCTKFSKLSYKRKKFYDFSTSKLLANFRVFDRFPTIRTTYKEPCIKFSIIQIFFTDTSKKNLHKNRKFQWSINNPKKFLNYNHIKNRFGRKLDLRKNSRFSVIFFFVFLDFFENCWKMLTFYLYNAPRIFTFTSETTPIV